jgi:signal transduction histidine kinase
VGESLQSEALQRRGATDPSTSSPVAELRSVMDDLPEGVAVLDAITGEVSQNTVADVLSRTVATSEAPSDVSTRPGSAGNTGVKATAGDHVDVALRTALAGTPILGEQFSGVDPATGKEVALLANSAPVRDDSGEIAGAVTLLQDITPLKEQERLRGERLAEAAHDLRNHLTGMLAMSQMLESHLNQHSTVDPSLLRRGLLVIASGVRRVDAQMDVVLRIAREQGETPIDLRREDVDLTTLTAEIIAEFQSPDGRHRIKLEAADYPLLGQFDAALLRTMLRNLLGNAIKFSPEGGDITICLDREPKGDGALALLKVTDQGVGIPAADLQHVFERYYRASNVIAVIPGTGLGLNGVRRTVERHGGSVSIDSSVGSGTTVTVRLPLVGRHDAGD